MANSFAEQIKKNIQALDTKNAERANITAADIMNKIGSALGVGSAANTPTPTPEVTTPVPEVTTPEVPQAAQVTTPQQVIDTYKQQLNAANANKEADSANKEAVNAQQNASNANANAAAQNIDYAARLQELGGGSYTPSATVQAAQQYLNSITASKPADYQSKYGDMLDKLYNQIMNREDFSYDMNADALYHQYKDQYQMMGQQAMQDTMGQAAAMTGGYGNSYANTAGQQAYQSYLQQLNNIIPTLRQQAFDIYQQEGEALQNRYAITQSADERDYGRWQDQYNSWLADRDYALNAYNNERSFDYNDYTNRLNTAQALLGYERADAQFDKEMAYDAQVREQNREWANQDWLRDAEYSAAERAENRLWANEDWQKEADYNTGRQEAAWAQDEKMAALGYQYNDKVNSQQSAQANAMTWLQEGLMPDDDVLAAAGISKDMALALAKENGYRESRSGSSSSNKNTSTGSSTTTNNTSTGNTVTYEDWLKKLLGK